RMDSCSAESSFVFRRLDAFCDFIHFVHAEYPVHVDHGDQFPFDLPDTGDDVEGGLSHDHGRSVDLVSRHADNLARGVHYHPDRSAIHLRDDYPSHRRVFAGLQTEPFAEVDDRYDIAPQIDDSLHTRRGLWQPGDLPRTDDLLHPKELQAVFLLADPEAD